MVHNMASDSQGHATGPLTLASEIEVTGQTECIEDPAAVLRRRATSSSRHLGPANIC